jgi:hypothetical protein
MGQHRFVHQEPGGHYSLTVGDPEPGDQLDGRPRISQDDDPLLNRLRKAHGPSGRADLVDVSREA